MYPWIKLSTQFDIDREMNEKRLTKTIRIELELEKTDDFSYPEFSFAALRNELVNAGDEG